MFLFDAVFITLILALHNIGIKLIHRNTHRMLKKHLSKKRVPENIDAAED